MPSVGLFLSVGGFLNFHLSPFPHCEKDAAKINFMGAKLIAKINPDSSHAQRDWL
jgi:hypothetical protein